ncbi:hypothetical protein Q4566_00010 [Tamlana sp. 2_MG-2023]|uniref:hypothetical protein n=1 Tax=unclassified Tamlana TaxID=2614803 RepID=UPI0026E18252|nr:MULTISPECIES: hypothetical protein [unclassified Tamlana]MDO6758564.1 hypothetical protein [Tamlana sp. 2_MG-2023]MDO6789263.1 hypothetical protein [Tamlana sp. 1_MG-2023]
MKYLITICFLFCYASSFSQYSYPKKEYAQLVLKSKLVVTLLEGESEYVANMNSSIKEIFTNKWTDTEVLFLTQPEIDNLRKVHKNGYSFLYQKAGESNERRFGEDNLGESYTYNAFTFSNYQYYLNILIDGKNHFVTGVDFGNANLMKADHLFLCQQLSKLIKASAEGKKSNQYFNVKNNIEQLKNSTLVLPRFMFREKDLDKIGNYYDYPFQLVDLQGYQEVILNEESGNSYVKIIWSRQHHLYVWVVVDATNGSIISINSFGGVHFGSDQTMNEVIKAKYLKYATSKFAQKVNNRYGRKL